MSTEPHAQAEKLITQDCVEGISQKERDWLAEHLRDCADCVQFAQQTGDALQALKTAMVPMPPGLAERTRFRVHLRAQELREYGPKRAWIWITCAVSWGFGVATAPYVWKAFEWIGQYTGAPKLLIEFGFGLWWTVPALFAGAAVLFESLRLGRENE